ncbi:MAG: hypothetical protein VB120_08605 [Lachnospiraceae bacterium]|nr:hypothetical protein [Lachnospiraceae bacterium]
MKKNHIRDYATEAFRFYARTGSAAKYKQELWDEVIKATNRSNYGGGIGNPTEAAVSRMEKRLEDARAEIADLEAVERTISTLEKMRNGSEMLLALHLVYMANPHKEIEKGEISERMHQAEVKIPASERQIYRWLSKARYIFATERGLRINF